MRPSRRALVGVMLGVITASLAIPFAARAESPEVGGYAAVQGTDGTGVRMRSGIWSKVLGNLPEGTMASILDENIKQHGRRG